MFILSAPFYNYHLFYLCAYNMPHSTFFLKHQTLYQNLYIKLVGNLNTQYIPLQRQRFKLQILMNK